jgi:hypothetical protein
MPGIPSTYIQQNVDFTGVTQLSFWYKIVNTQNNEYDLQIYIDGVNVEQRIHFADTPWTQFTRSVSYSGIKLLEVYLVGYDRTPHPAVYLDDFEMMKMVWVDAKVTGVPSIVVGGNKVGNGISTSGGQPAWGP